MVDDDCSVYGVTKACFSQENLVGSFCLLQVNDTAAADTDLLFLFDNKKVSYEAQVALRPHPESVDCIRKDFLWHECGGVGGKRSVLRGLSVFCGLCHVQRVEGAFAYWD